MKSKKKEFCVHLLSFVMLIALLWSVPSEAQKLGSIYFGADNALKEVLLGTGSTTYRVDDLGLVFGFILPIKTGRVDYNYNTRVGFNGVTDILYSTKPSSCDIWYYRNMDHYCSILNEVLIGKRIDLSRRTYIRPMLGAGFLLDLLWGEGPGFAYATFEIGLTTQAMYVLKHVEIGTMLSFQYIPYDGYFQSQDLTHISVAVILSR